MDPPDPFAAGGKPSPGKRSELQGPRPTPLKVNKDSYKIKKPPVAPPHPHHHHNSQPPPPPPGSHHHQQDPQNPQPVIIYAVSPKIIHVRASDFMDLVQRLTGSSSSSSTTDTGGDVSPAARLASTERTSPSERDQRVSSTADAAAAASISGGDEVSRILEQTNIQMGQNIPSILSPAPATLPPISPPGLFSPMMDPFMHQVSNMFIPSPSTLFSAPMASPSPSYHDLFTPFFDF